MAKTKVRVQEEEVLHTEEDRPIDVIEQFVSYAEMADKGEFGQSIVLSEMRDPSKEVYKLYGFESFKDLVGKHPSLIGRIELRKAYWLADIGDFLRKHEITAEEMASLNTTWTKVKELIKVCENKRDFVAEVKKTKDMSVREAADYVQTVRVTASGGEVEQTTTIKIKMLNEQAAVYKEAIETAKLRYGVTIDEVALECILSEFLVSTAKSESDAVAGIVKHVTAMAEKKAKAKARAKETKKRPVTKKTTKKAKK